MWIRKKDVKNDDNYDTDIVMKKICDTKKKTNRGMHLEIQGFN